MGLLADWTVRINTTGAQDAAKGAAAVKEQLTLGQAAAKQFTGFLMGIAKAFAPIAVLGFVLKKAMESEQGEALMEVFSEIGDILARLIVPIIGLVASILTRWIPVLEKVVGLIAPMIDLLAQIVDVVFLVGGAVIEYLLLPIQAVLDLISEITGISIVSKFDPIKKSGDKDKKGKAGGIEDPTAIFKRIQETIAGGIEKDKLEALKGIRKNSEGIEKAIKELKPAVA